MLKSGKAMRRPTKTNRNGLSAFFQASRLKSRVGDFIEPHVGIKKRDGSFDLMKASISYLFSINYLKKVNSPLSSEIL